MKGENRPMQQLRIQRQRALQLLGRDPTLFATVLIDPTLTLSLLIGRAVRWQASVSLPSFSKPSTLLRCLRLPRIPERERRSLPKDLRTRGSAQGKLSP